MTAKDIYWLAGLLEGEGCFRTGSNSNTPYAVLQMTDLDIVERSARLVGNPSIAPVARAAPRKIIYRWNLTGRRAAALMMTVYALMGTRRQARIAAVLRTWRRSPLRVPIAERRRCQCGVSFNPNPHRNTGELCRRCYLRRGRYLRRMREWGITAEQRSLL